jgi:signal transduction histidine kinase
MTSAVAHTELLRGRENITKRAQSFMRNAKSKLDICLANLVSEECQEMFVQSKIFSELLGSEVKLRLICEITPQNAGYYKQLAERIEVRHLEGIKSSFALSDSEYLAMIEEKFPDGPILCIGGEAFVKHHQALFEMLWDRSVPADFRTRQLEGGLEIGGTQLTFSTTEVFEWARRFANEMKEEALILVPRANGVTDNLSFFREVASRARRLGVTVRMLARFSKEEIESVVELENSGFEIRRPGLGHRFNLAIGIYDRRDMGIVEQIGRNDPSGHGPALSLSGLISKDKQLIEWVAAVYEILWENAIPASDAIAEIETGINPPGMQIIHDPTKVAKIFCDLINQSKLQVLLLMPTVNAIRREETIGAMECLRKASARGVDARVISPADPTLERYLTIPSATGNRAGIATKHRANQASNLLNTVTILVVDRSASLVVEQKDDSQIDFEKAIGVSTFSTRNSTVLANVRTFEQLWEGITTIEREAIALEQEQRSRKAAELMQDVLAHDIRNYNQITRTSVEILNDIVNTDGQKSNPNSKALVNAIMRATDDSSELIEKTKKLGKIISQQKSLVPVVLESSLRRSLTVMKAACPKKNIVPTLELKPEAKVLADDLLDEIFTNLFSNAVNYTEGDFVPIEIATELSTLENCNGKFWKITVTDHGRGIPDSMKEKLFARYLETASGTGLGLSIVYALTVERYSGKITVKDRVQGNYRSGTSVQLLLPCSS